MAKTFMQMAEEVMAQVQGVSAEEAYQRLKQDSNASLVDVRDAAEIPIHRPGPRWGEHLPRPVGVQGRS